MAKRMLTEKELQAHATASYLRTILASVLGYQDRVHLPFGMPEAAGTERNGTLRIEMYLSNEDAAKLANHLNVASGDPVPAIVAKTPCALTCTSSGHAIDCINRR